MSPWHLLGIEPCDDVRQVKRAYAKMLKQTRPDEKPAEFQALHQAYKQALWMAERQANAAQAVGEQPVQVAPDAVRQQRVCEVENQQPTTADPAPNAPEIEAAPAVDPVAEREAEQQKIVRRAAFEEALKQVDKVLENDRLISLESHWRFLADNAFLLEDDFNRELGFQVFKRIAEHNDRVKDYPLVTANILAYCDRTFGWRGQRWFLYRQLGRELCDNVFTALEEYSEHIDPVSGLRGGAKIVKQTARQQHHRTETFVRDLESYYFAGLLTRALALLLDCFLVYVLLYVTLGVAMIKISDREEGEVTLLVIILTVIGYLLMAWIMESSPRQATLGKSLFGYRVTNRQFARLGYLHGFGRIASFALTLPLAKVGWLINCFLGGNLMHDRLSRTYVIDVRKSLKEHEGGT